jgi:hypothetical protein
METRDGGGGRAGPRGVWRGGGSALDEPHRLPGSPISPRHDRAATPRGHHGRHRHLRAAGARFESSTRFRDIFASHVTVDGRLVTGQNQNDGAETADRMMQVILDASRKEG